MGVETSIKGVSMDFNDNIPDNSVEREFSNEFKLKFDRYLDNIIEVRHFKELEDMTNKQLEEYLENYKDTHVINIDNVRNNFRNLNKKILKEKYVKKYVTSAFAELLKEWYRERPGDIPSLKNSGLFDAMSKGKIELPGVQPIEFRMSPENLFDSGVNSVFFYENGKTEYVIFNADGSSYVDTVLSRNLDGVKINTTAGKTDKDKEKIDNLKAIIDINQGNNIVDTLRNLIDFLKDIGGLDILDGVESFEGFEFFGGYKVELLKNDDGGGISFRIVRPSLVGKKTDFEEGFVSFDKDFNYSSMDFENENMYQGRLLTASERKSLEQEELKYVKELDFKYSDIDLIINKLTGSPKEQQEVIDYLTSKRTKYYETVGRDDLDSAYYKGSQYFPYMRGVINSETDKTVASMPFYQGKTREEIGMPITMVDKLPLLSIPESHWRESESFSGAHGPLQIMPSTAKRHGMKLGGLTRKSIPVGAGDSISERPYYVVDQRRDPIASARLEAQHMFAPESRQKTDIRNIDFRLRLAMYNGNIVNTYFNTVEKGVTPTYSGYLKYLGTQLKQIKHKVKGGSQEDKEQEFKRAIRFIRENLEYPFKFYAVLNVVDRNKNSIRKQESLQMEEVRILPRTIKPIEHKIQSGESYESIAKNNKIPLDLLLRFNGIQKKDMKKIKAGNSIKIPYRMPQLSLMNVSESLGVNVQELLKLNPSISPEGVNYNLLSLSGFSLYLPIGKGREFNKEFGKHKEFVKESDITMYVDGKIKEQKLVS